MSLHHLTTAFGEAGAGKRLVSSVGKGKSPVRVTDLVLAAHPLAIAALIEAKPASTLILTSRNDRADAMAAAVNEYLPTGRRAIVWPSPDGPPYEQLPFDLAIATQRVAILDRLLNSSGNEAPVVVASVRGLSQLLLSPAELTEQRRALSVGDRLDAQAFFGWATQVGFEAAPMVQEPGTIARRGGIIDVYPAGADEPIRIDLFGDTIESIRTFNVSSQRSEKKLRTVTLLPPTELPLWHLADAAREVQKLPLSHLRDEVKAEWLRMVDRMEAGGTPASVDIFAPYLLTEPANLLDYVSERGLVIIEDAEAVELSARQIDSHASELLAGFIANRELPEGLKQPYASWDNLHPEIARRQLVELGSLREEGATTIELSSVGEAPVFAGRLTRLTEEIGEKLKAGWRVALATDQVDRLTEVFEANGIYPRRDKRRHAADATPLAPGDLDVLASDLNGGWMIEKSKVLVLSDQEIFGFRKQTRRGSRRTLSDNLAFASSLVPGEFVVHIDHGVAKFVGLVRVDTSGVEREYLLLEYAKGEKLYVPVDQSDRVTRYSGGGIDPVVTKLGSGEWVKTKQRVRRAVREMAFELIQLYASREATTGRALGPDTLWDVELTESFPYTETVDQQRAIDETKQDQESPKPMDRLICGDVGFGKTEVALRAAFKAVNAGMQAAVLVPTTVLALQHYTTISQRLASYPIRVEMLSRLRSAAEQREILQKLAEGAVDIIIGTHRLVQKDVEFKNLGLIVIDEEQRFGVRHKEYLKQKRTEVDVLTMSATPIPRTLHMSLSGIRDISIIDTAPHARLPVRTFVTESNDQILREVILREIDRGGQVFVVHNRVHSIDRLAHHLREIVPEATFAVGHGQMEEDVLEEVILGFVRHDYDVLVCTTIIESGVDIPNANTIVIDNADTLGLTQLYQLRGRVGRGPSRAYAYLLYRKGKPLTPEAQERLEAIQEATELGAGLRVAMRDMEIRGAGNILGAEQSGHISEIGYDLYVRLLAQAVEEVKSGRPMSEPISITLDLPLTALIPASYVADVELRLATYRRVAAVTSRAELDAMRDELEDRFGPIPEEVEHLCALIALRLRCADLGIESMVEREREIVIRPVVTSRVDVRRLNQRFANAIKATPNSIRLRLPDLEDKWMDAVDMVLDAIEVSHANRLNGDSRTNGSGAGRSLPRRTPVKISRDRA
jgi:transcription-repair coupling factor (superfamily II helicase)